MSNIEQHPQETRCGGRTTVAVDPVREVQTGAAGFAGARLPAPALPTSRLKPRGRQP